jgi:hypothetical protein
LGNWAQSFAPIALSGKYFFFRTWECNTSLEREFYADQTLLKDLGFKSYNIRAMIKRKMTDDNFVFFVIDIVLSYFVFAPVQKSYFTIFVLFMEMTLIKVKNVNK